MAFKKGDPKPANSGSQKGTRQQRTMLREQLEAKGIDLADELVKLFKEASSFDERAEVWKLAAPYCIRKMPTDHNVTGDMGLMVDYTAVLKAHGITPRATKEEN